MARLAAKERREEIAELRRDTLVGAESDPCVAGAVAMGRAEWQVELEDQVPFEGDCTSGRRGSWGPASWLAANPGAGAGCRSAGSDDRLLVA